MSYIYFVFARQIPFSCYPSFSFPNSNDDDGLSTGDIILIVFAIIMIGVPCLWNIYGCHYTFCPEMQIPGYNFIVNRDCLKKQSSDPIDLHIPPPSPLPSSTDYELVELSVEDTMTDISSTSQQIDAAVVSVSQ